MLDRRLKRFTVVMWGNAIGHGSTHDEVHSLILDCHARRQKAMQFRIDFAVAIASPGEQIPYSHAYTIVDNHEETS